jgi:hypothetical protein
MKRLRLILSLDFMVPTWAVIGAFTTLDSGMPLAFGLTMGFLLGVFFGLVFGGNPKWKVWGFIFGPENPKRCCWPLRSGGEFPGIRRRQCD